MQPSCGSVMRSGRDEGLASGVENRAEGRHRTRRGWAWSLVTKRFYRSLVFTVSQVCAPETPQLIQHAFSHPLRETLSLPTH